MAYSNDYYTRFYVLRSVLDTVKLDDPDYLNIMELVGDAYAFLMDAVPDPVEEALQEMNDEDPGRPHGYL